MLEILIVCKGEPTCGKTRATRIIQQALKEQLPDKEYHVNWYHKLPDGEVSEEGTFKSGE